MYATVLLLWQLVLGGLLVSAAKPSKTRRDNTPPITFVTTNNGQFRVNGSAFGFVGTNAYWLSTLNSDKDIDETLGNISAAGIKVVRTWAFNDVDTIPVNGTWFQLIANGTTSINNGTNGLKKLDTVVQLAQKHGIYLLMSLTNNWNPLPLVDNLTATAGSGNLLARDVTNGTNNTLPRNTLSNDYGGMDLYVRQFVNSASGRTHDQFYTNPTIINAFENYTTQVVSRYVNSPAILGWEIANDPRCNSSIPASAGCNTMTITTWHNTIANHIKTVDPNHLVSSGNQGFFCADCQKMFFKPALSPPTPSGTPGRRKVARSMTKARLLQERKEALKKERSTQKRTDGIRIRGSWVSTATRRQSDIGVGSAFDGSQGIDSEDILSIGNIDFGSFQLFPDQNSYGPVNPNILPFNNTVQTGLDWINSHAELGQLLNKPVTLTGFGLVTQNNSAVFVPFNSTTPQIVQAPGPNPAPQIPSGFVTDSQRDDAYTQWLNAGLLGGLQGMTQYQWTQGNLTTSPGTTISQTTTGQSPDVTTTGQSPNDGYGIGVGPVDTLGSIFQNASGTANIGVGLPFAG